MLHNLLSKKIKKRIRKEYYLRRVVIGSLLFSGTVVVGLVALIPAYVDVSSELSFYESEYEKRQGDGDNDAILLKKVSEDVFVVDTLEQEFEKEKLTKLLNEVMRLRPDGIRIVGFSYNRNGSSLTLEGVAETRGVVESYAKILEKSEYFYEVSDPVGDLAKKTNLTFNLSLTIDGEDNEEI